MATLICPKCRGEMHSYERKGVTVEQCSDCRGLFLDRGELERLAAAEAQWFDRPQAAGPAQAHPAPSPGQVVTHRYKKYDDDDDDDDRHRYGGGYKGKRKSFLDELFG
jgi:hypothetical protein